MMAGKSMALRSAFRSGEHHELFDDFGRFERLLFGPLKQIASRSLSPLVAGFLQAAENAHEGVVEVVGDTGGELAHCLHLLRLAEPLFVLL